MTAPAPQPGRSVELLLRLSCPPAGRRAFQQVYAYFRVLDDRADAPGALPAQAAAAVARHLALLDGAAPCDPVEAALAEVRAGPLGPAMGPAIEGMGAAIAWDARRRGRSCTQAELEAQITRIGDAYLRALWVCSGARGPLPEDLCWLSRAATGAHQLRDLEEDLGLGYLNVPVEALAELGLEGVPAASLDRSRLAPWIAARCVALDRAFDRGEAHLPAVRPLRCRTLITAFSHRYRWLLARQRPASSAAR